MANTRNIRQLLLFGDKGQAKIEEAHVGIIGLGGLGSQLIQGLAYLGVKDYILIDPDYVEKSNLNRLIGAYPPDAEAHTFKVEVANRQIHLIQPQAQVRMVGQSLRTTEAIQLMTTCSVLFGCVDNDAVRLIMDELAAAYNIPLIDLATEINPDEETGITYGGRVVVTCPGEFCLSCAGEIDYEQAKQELEDKQIRQIRQRLGYGAGEHAPAPAVVSLNGVIANLALTEFMVMVTGLRAPNKYLHYPAERNEENRLVIKPRIFAPNPDCYICGYLAGKGDAANIYRYISN